MKKIYTLFTLLLLVVSVFAAGPKRDFRASWVATVWGIDWPKSKVVSEQKKEMDIILDRAQSGNMTAVMLQVRGFSDAIYRSSYDPWSSALTGTRGKDPGYDPLQYAIEGAHRRGLELHVWINPYRLGTYSVRAPQIKDSWILPAGILDPGNPDVRKYILDVIAEIIDNYDIDGILFDDYFYKSMDKNDYVTNETHQTIENNPYDLSLNDWRRENVNIFVRDVMKLVETKKPYLRFGIGPAGIWSTTSHKVYDEDYNTYDYITANLGTWDVYSELYCDAATWLKRGYIDYISPQLYWPMLSSSNGYYASSAFDKLCLWWADLAKRYGRHFYVSQDVADNNSNGSTTARYNSPEEINAQMQTARANGNVQGHIFYSTQYFLNLRGVNAKWFSSSAEGYHTFLTQSWFADKSIAPAIEWRDAPELPAPSELVLSGSTLTWKHPSAPRFTVYAYPKGTAADVALEDASNLLGVTYSNTFDVSSVADLADKTLAVCAYDRYGNEYTPALYNEGENTIVEGTVSMTQLWQQPQSTSGYLTTTNANRSMAYYDGALYIPNKDAGTFAVVDASTGALRTTRTITASAFWQHNLRITSDGQMLLGNTGAGSTSLLVKSSSLNNGGATDLNTFAISGRTDYFYSYGDWNGTGFLLALSNTGNLLKVPFVGGLLGAETSVSNASLPSGTSSKAIPADAASFYASTANRLPSRHDTQTGNLLESFDAANAPEAVNASGMAVFSMQGHTYMVLPHDVFGSFEVYEITYGLSNAKRVIEATATLGSNTNAAFTVDFCTAVEDTEATIYVLAPNNGVAAYRFVFTPKETALPQVDDTDNVLVRSTIDGVAVSFSGTKTVEVYTVNGILVDRQTVLSTYSRTLPQGMYILRVGNSVHKFIR